jgi:hypothetical protein
MPSSLDRLFSAVGLSRADLQMSRHKPSNQALERTADRREDLLRVTSTLKPEAELAVVSGRSAWSR